MVQFVDSVPSKSKAKREHWVKAAQTLRENPGKWGFVGEYSVGVANHIRKGRYVAFLPPGLAREEREPYVRNHWEVTVTTGDPLDRIYIRWSPPDDCSCPWCRG